MATTGANNKELRDYLCAITGVTDVGYVQCSAKSEETLVRARAGCWYRF
jgi:hypothetical protein